MWNNGRAPYKVARAENENDISAFSTGGGAAASSTSRYTNNTNNDVSNNNNTTTASIGDRLRSSAAASVVASCSGAYITATLSHCSNKNNNNNNNSNNNGNTLQLDVWRHQQQQQQQQYNAPVFSSRIALPKNFIFTPYDEEIGAPSCFIGEGADGTSVVICDKYGSCGTISINNSSNSASSSNNNNNNNNNTVYLHTHTLNSSALYATAADQRTAVISAFCCINGQLFLGTTLGGVSSIRVVNRDSADNWTVMTTRNTSNSAGFGNDNSNGSGDENNNNGNTGSSSSSSWTSRFFGGFFGGGGNANTSGDDNNNNKNQTSASSPVAKNNDTFNTQQAAVTRVFPSAIDQETSIEHPPAFFAIHGLSRVVFYGPFSWEWSIDDNANNSSRILAVGDCAESGAVYALHTASRNSGAATNNSLGDFLLVTLLSFSSAAGNSNNNNNTSSSSSSETLAVVPLRPLSEEDLNNSNIYPVRYAGERRALIITPQFAAAYTVAVGPRAPTDEITTLESRNVIISSQMVSSSSSTNQKGGATLTLLLANNNNNSSVGSLRTVPMTDVFSSALNAQNDRQLQQAVSQLGSVDQGFLAISNAISIFSQSNPWNWSSSNANNANAVGDNKENNNNSNLLTFITQNLNRRVKDHENFLNRQQGRDQWSDTSNTTRCAILENHVGLTMLKAIRDVQNTCRLHVSVSDALDSLWNSDLDRAKYFGEVFAALLPRAARHPKCVQLQQANTSSSSSSEAEIVFHHPQNAFVFLFEAASALREMINNVSISIQDKLLWSSIIGTLWLSCGSAALKLVDKYASESGSNGELASILEDMQWLDTALPQLLQTMSDSIAISVSTTPSNRERQIVQSSLIDVVADLTDVTIRTHSKGKSIAADLIKACLLREPFLRSASIGFPFGFPEADTNQQQHQENSIGRKAIVLAERITLHHTVFSVMWDFCSSAYLSSNSQDLQQVSRQQQQECHFHLKRYCETIPGFFEYVATALLEQNREIELTQIDTIVPFVCGIKTDVVRKKFLATNAPSLLWTMDSSAIESILSSGYEAHPSAQFANTGAEHRSVCAALAKLAWVAESRPLKNRKKIVTESKTSAAQLRFLGNTNNNNNTNALNQIETIRALLSLQTEPDQNFLAAADLAETLPPEDPSRTAMLMEIVQKCYQYEGAKLVNQVNNHNIGDTARIQMLNNSVTIRTFKKSNTLMVMCAGEDEGAIQNVTSQDYAQMLRNWRNLTTSQQ